MNKIFLPGMALALALFVCPAYAQNLNADSMVRAMSENYARHQLESGTPSGLSSGDEQAYPRNTFIFVPTFSYTHNANLGDLSGDKLLSGNGTSKAAGFALVGKRKVTDTITLTAKYEYSYTSFSGSSMHPSPVALPFGTMSFSSNTKQNVNTHTFLLAAEKDFGVWGRLSLALIQSFCDYSGHESLYSAINNNPNPADRRSVDSTGRVSVLGATYMKGFTLAPSLTLTPYLGGTLTYVDLNKLNDFTASYTGKHMNAHAWAQDFYAGLILEKQSGPWTFAARAGLSQLLTKHAIGGYMVRSVAPETTQAGFNVGGDKTLASFGGSIAYFLPQHVLLSLGYNGTAGSRTTGHTVTFAVVVPF